MGFFLLLFFFSLSVGKDFRVSSSVGKLRE